MIFADKLITLRKKAGWSQEELARLPLLRNTKLRWIGKLMHSPMTMAIM